MTRGWVIESTVAVVFVVLWGGLLVYETARAGSGSADSPLSSSPSWMGEGNEAHAYYGNAVAGAGDINNDGYDDVIIGAYQYDGDWLNGGRVLAHYGRADGLRLLPQWAKSSDQSWAMLGWDVSGAGDVNSDGYDDLVVGDPNYRLGETYLGAAFLFLGGANGLSDRPDWTRHGDQSGATFGCAVDGAGDINGDGYDDVIAGASFYNEGESDEGAAFVFNGQYVPLDPPTVPAAGVVATLIALAGAGWAATRSIRRKGLGR